MMPVFVKWNTDKPHRCPKCHAVAVAGGRPSSWRAYGCCMCATDFARWPRIARFLPFVADTCDCGITYED